MTVVMPRSFNILSRSVPRNLSGPDVTEGSPGLAASAGATSPMDEPAVRLYTTATLPARALSANFATAGTDAMQRGRRSLLQTCLLKSRRRSAVVALSRVMGLGSGA
jgi:hypothetical protein